ncbi:MAG: guanylate kinase [Phycisphaerales bacterium]|nr:guanylate kinase [Phycisphaerales bacterium]
MTTDWSEGKGLALIVSGPSGAGKTTIARALERACPDAWFSVSLTTRPPGPGDRDGLDYRFVSEEQFATLATPTPGSPMGEFLEHAGVYGRRYGTLRAPVEDNLRAGRLVILEIDVQGGKIVKAAMPHAAGVFVLPPSDDALLARLRARRRDSEDAIQRRFAAAQREMAEARTCGVYDRFIVNDTLDRAVAEAVEVVQGIRRGR